MAAGSPRGYFFGDPVEVDPEIAAEAIGDGELQPQEVVEQAIIEETPNDAAAVEKLEAYSQLSPTDKAQYTAVPALAVWGANITTNPLRGKVLAANLNYNLMKSLNEYPYEGRTYLGVYSAEARTLTVTISESVEQVRAVPFFRFALAASSLAAQIGGIISLDVIATDGSGRTIDTRNTGYTYSFQRRNNVEAVEGIYVPFQVIATRTLPFLALFGGNSQITMTIIFTNVQEGDTVSVTVPGYATNALRETSLLYNLPAGDIK